MEKYKGIIWIKNIQSGSKSDGNKAYFIDHEFNHFLLYRKGIFEINDDYFYPYQLKNVEVAGQIQKGKWIMVENIDFVHETDSTIKCTDKFYFTKSDFPDILYSEGPLLSIVEQKNFTADDIINFRLWLKAHLNVGVSIYAKVNESALLFFFQGRLSVKELFMLRNEEQYIIEDKENGKSVFKKLHYSDQFESDILNNIPCSNYHYYSIAKDMRLNNPFEEVIKKLDLYFINAHESQKPNK